MKQFLSSSCHSFFRNSLHPAAVAFWCCAVDQSANVACHGYLYVRSLRTQYIYQQRMGAWVTKDPNVFNPLNRLPSMGWPRPKQAGMRGLLHRKHHDCFCLGRVITANTQSAESRWKDGRGRCLRDLSAACKGTRVEVWCLPFSMGCESTRLWHWKNTTRPLSVCSGKSWAITVKSFWGNKWV